MTLKQFVKKNGGYEKTAQMVSCSWSTLWRIVNKKTKPSNLLKMRLKELGVEIDDKGGK